MTYLPQTATETMQRCKDQNSDSKQRRQQPTPAIEKKTVREVTQQCKDQNNNDETKTTTTNLCDQNYNSNRNNKTVQGPQRSYTESYLNSFGAVLSLLKIGSAETLRQPRVFWHATEDLCWGLLVPIPLVHCWSKIREPTLHAHIGMLGLLLIVDNRQETLVWSHRKSFNSAPPQHRVTNQVIAN